MVIGQSVGYYSDNKCLKTIATNVLGQCTDLKVPNWVTIKTTATCKEKVTLCASYSCGPCSISSYDFRIDECYQIPSISQGII